MDLSREQLTELCSDICPHCARGVQLRQRDDTREYVHDHINSTGMSHGLCLASHFRNKYESVLNG